MEQAANIVESAGLGDMLKSIYDPRNKSQDVFKYVEDKAAEKADKPTIVTGTLSTGQTSLILENANIKTDSLIDVYTSKYGINPVNVVAEEGKVILTFEAQSISLGIRVEVR